MRIIFAGTPEFACPALSALINSQHEIIAVYTQPDRTSGRNRSMSFSPVKNLALKHNLLIEQPLNFKENAVISTFRAYKPDIFIVAAYGLILPESILKISKYNLNIHASLLPKWRGASPIQSAILAGDAATGVTIMEVIQELDAGPIVNSASIGIDSNTNTSSLTNSLSLIGADLLIETINSLDKLWPARIQQNHNYSSHAPKIKKEMALIDWHEPAELIERKIRAFQPWPGSISYISDNRIKIIEIEIFPETSLRPGEIILLNNKIMVGTGSYDIAIKKLQIPNKQAMTAAEVICGYKNLFRDQVFKASKQK